MNQDCIYKPSARCRKPLSIRLNPVPINEKAVYVHSVCAVLIDSRFGMGRSTPFVVDQTELPETEGFYDLTMPSPDTCYTILPDSKASLRYSDDTIRCELARAKNTLAASSNPKLSPSAQGRGSP